MRRFGSDNMKSMMERLGMDDSSQSKVKWFHERLNLLKNELKVITLMHVNNLLQYDDVLRQQREIIYKQRFEVLDSENLT